MKISTLFLLTLICLSLAFALFPPISAEPQHLVISDVQRNVHLQDYGLLLTNDTVTITNFGSDPAYHVSTAFPLSLMTHVQDFSAELESGTSLMTQSVPLIGTNCTGWKIYIPEPIMPGQNFTFRSLMILEGLVEYRENTIRCEFSPVPTSPYFIRQYSTKFTHYSGVTAPSKTDFTGENISALSYQAYNVTLSTQAGTKPKITYLQLTRQLTLDPWGYLQVLETHRIRCDSLNLYGWGWRTIAMTLPLGSEYLGAFDRVSNLTSRITEPANLTQSGTLEVDTAFKLDEGDIYEFVIQYRIPLDVNQQVLQYGFLLEFDPHYELNGIIRHQITEVVLPEGSRLLGVPPLAETTITPTGQYVIKLHEYNVTSLHKDGFSFHYVYLIQPGFFSRPMLLASFIGVILLAYVALRRVPFLREEEEMITGRAEIEPALLGDFCALYGEKVALLLQTERLERSMLAQKISKPRYRKEKKIFERKIRSIGKELEIRSRPLIEVGGKYESSVRQLELLEAERLSSIEALHALEQRFKQKRIATSVYQKLRSDLEKRRDKSVSKMDRILLDLRGEFER